MLTLRVALGEDIRPGQALTNVLTITTAAAEDDLSNNTTLHAALVPTNSLVPASAALLGPETGLVNARHWFTASVTPATVALPLTYTWQASAQPPVIRAGGLSDTLSFVWDQPCTQAIRVTAANAFGSVGASATISLTDEAIAGLQAVNDGPTQLGRATAFTAVISAGTNVTYD